MITSKCFSDDAKVVDWPPGGPLIEVETTIQGMIASTSSHPYRMTSLSQMFKVSKQLVRNSMTKEFKGPQ